MEPSSSSSVITPEEVLETMMNDGTIDAIRLKIITHLKANEELKNTTIKMVEQSKVLNTPGAEKQTKRELFDALRQELETSVLEKASKSVWELILDQNGIGKEISGTVEDVFCRLSGRESPLFPAASESKPEKDDGDAEEREAEKKGSSDISSKKRKLHDLGKNTEEGEGGGICVSAPNTSHDNSTPEAVDDSSNTKMSTPSTAKP
ncbi:hypothetical protein DM860_017860 [Cuscuta australis]|uniref:Uncharacterized protein n=1 Tax=Cuscuta australis TaxID=267555 RepID=A0A328DUI9_9ASTE|nr:hypothetical protein DM860_017860 [Cuscuta australis]